MDMANYDFHKLSPFDFERLCCELLRIQQGLSFHTFREGRDGGIDILCADDLSGEIVYQCKRYADRNALFSELKDELPKVRRLKPSRYGLLTSLQLTPFDKQQIKDLFAPYVKSLDDIYDGCDLNALLEKESAKSVVNHYPALWLTGFHVLARSINNDIIGRSDFLAQEAVDSSSGCVWTAAMSAAQERLDKEHVVVLTGDPGVGKTVTAKMLFAKFVRQGYEPVVTFNDIEDLEQLFEPGKKQVFYFDDFLGHQVLEAALSGQAKGVCQFINRVQHDETKRFILTSRTAIVNQGICSSPMFKNVWRVAPSYFYRVDGYSNFDRARILYSHMISSTLPKSLVMQLVENKCYWKIIGHRNFNPRIIELILANRLLRKVTSEDRLFDIVKGLLDSPSEVWKDAFEQTLTPEERLIVWVVFLMPAIGEDELRNIFSRYLLLQNDASLGNVAFDSSVRTLVDSMLARRLDYSGKVTYGLRNPSVGDYLLSRMGGDFLWVKDVIPAINDYQALERLRELRQKVHVNRELLGSIFLSLLKKSTFASNPELAVAMWREVCELDLAKARSDVIGLLKESQIEGCEIANCDCLADVLAALDESGVDLIRDCGLSLSPDVVDAWIQGCKEFESVARLYKIVVKYKVTMPPNMSICLTYCMKLKAWDIAGELAEPEFETDEYGRQHIADGEEDYLREGIEDGVRKMLVEHGVPESMVDIWECAHEPDLDEIFRPPSEQCEYESDGRGTQGGSGGERSLIDNMFASIRQIC